ncbi:MAG: trimethylamine methyltransferase family protein [Lentisphaerae bacterium]|nr:trimethylamine methyltransferase family protein [Lentisphaerota bacterium]
MTPADCQQLHEISLRILEEIGVRLEHDRIVERMLKAGARPGAGSYDIRFPREMVQEQLACAPRAVELADRGRSGVTRLTQNSPSVYWTSPAMYFWTGAERRALTSDDLGNIARLCEGLEQVQGIMGAALADVPPPCRDFTGLRVIAENSRKHIRVLCFTPPGMEALKEMKAVFPGNWFSIGFTAHGPLRWTNLALDIFLKSAGAGIPTTINGEPMAGVTGPVSLAGTLAIGNAEILSGIVVNQVLEPGRPVIYNLGLAHVFDMKHATAVTGGPENALFAKASAELGRFYGLPSSSWVSTEALFEDEQAALEKMFGFHTHTANGVSLVWGMGQLESEMTISLGQLVIDNEMIGYVKRYERGFTVDPANLQYDLIRATGISGSFLEAEHTLASFREHLFEPRVLNRGGRGACAETLAEVARRQAAAIIAADQETKIDAAELAELRRIEQKYRELLAK